MLDMFPSTTSNHKQMMFFTYNFKTFGVSTPVFSGFLDLLESPPTSRQWCVSHTLSTTKFACGEGSCKQ